MRIIGSLLALFALALPAGAQSYSGGFAAGSSTIISGTTPITGGADTAICFNDAGTANCGNTNAVFDKVNNRISAPQLAVNSNSGVLFFGSAFDTRLYRDAAYTLAQRNGANAQSNPIYNNYTDASNGEWGFGCDWKTTANVCTIGTKANGTGTVRGINFDVGGTTAITISSTGLATFNNGFVTSTARFSNINNNNSSNTIFTFTNGNANTLWATGATAPVFQFAGTTSSYPALKRSSAALQVRLADDSAFALIQGKHQTDTAYTAGVTTATGFLVLYDSTGTAYKVNACTGC